MASSLRGNFKAGQDDDPGSVRALLGLLQSQSAQPVPQDEYLYTPRSGPSRASRRPVDTVAQSEADDYTSPATISKSFLSSSTLSTSSSASSIAPQESPGKERDIRHLSFSQALPILIKLAQSPNFLEAVIELKQQQDTLEEELYDGRLQLTGENGQRLTGKGSALVQAQVAEYDRHCLKRWDAMTRQQQERLQELGVPCFFPSTNSADVAKQDRVMQLLSGLLEEDDEENKTY